MTTFKARVPQLGARGLPGHQIFEATNVAPGPEDGNIGDVAIQYNDDGSVLLYQQKTEAGWPEDPRQLRGVTGATGWSPVLAVEQTEEGLVFRVVDWTGGEGTKPTSGLYIGDSGLVVEIDNALTYSLVGTATNIAFDNLDEEDAPRLPGLPEDVQDALSEIAATFVSTAEQDFDAAGQLQARENIGAIGNLLARTVYSSSGTHTFHSDCKRYFVQVQAAGGGGGGVATTTGRAGAGGGGGSGEYSEGLSTRTSATATVTIGSGGSGGDNTGASGSIGGNSSFNDGTINVATNGGRAGAGGSNGGNGFIVRVGGAETSTSGTSGFKIPGEPGLPGFSAGATISGIASPAIGGRGGSSKFGTGGAPGALHNNSNDGQAGSAGNGRGSGGGGAASVENATRFGGAGANGLVIVWEFG